MLEPETVIRNCRMQIVPMLGLGQVTNRVVLEVELVALETPTCKVEEFTVTNTLLTVVHDNWSTRFQPGAFHNKGIPLGKLVLVEG